MIAKHSTFCAPSKHRWTTVGISMTKRFLRCKVCGASSTDEFAPTNAFE